MNVEQAKIVADGIANDVAFALLLVLLQQL
jgi:hypothetical protein